MVGENKHRICQLLCALLKETRDLHDLEELEYVPEKELVYASFRVNAFKVIDVTADSGIAMIKDIVNHLA